MTSRPSTLLPRLVLVATSACGLTAQQAGQRAGAGAAEAIQEHVESLDASQPGPAYERAGRGIAKGVVAQLDDPEQLAQLQVVAREAAAAALRGLASADAIASISDQAARGAMQALILQLGADGDGPLARSLYATVARFSASAVRGIEQEARLFPACTGPERERCVEDRLEGLARAASRGVRDGLRGLIFVPALLLSFLVGAGSTLVLSWAMSHHRHASVG